MQIYIKNSYISKCGLIVLVFKTLSPVAMFPRQLPRRVVPACRAATSAQHRPGSNVVDSEETDHRWQQHSGQG